MVLNEAKRTQEADGLTVHIVNDRTGERLESVLVHPRALSSYVALQDALGEIEEALWRARHRVKQTE